MHNDLSSPSSSSSSLGSLPNIINSSSIAIETNNQKAVNRNESGNNFTSSRLDPAFAQSESDPISSEMKCIRSKYDDVIAYTVHLNAERDALMVQLEESKREIKRLVARNTPLAQIEALSKKDKVLQKVE